MNSLTTVLLLPLGILILVLDLKKIRTSVSNGSSLSSKTKESSHHRSCFNHLQAAENQDVQWQKVNETTNRKKNNVDLFFSCPRVSWEHDTHDSSCQVNHSFDAGSFLSAFQGRSLLLAGDSLSSMACRDLQDVLKDYRSQVVNSSYSSDPFQKQVKFGCQEFDYGVLICCSWLAFSNAKRERHFANQNLFSATNNGIALNVLEPPDLMIWNTGVHHTSAFAGTIDHMTLLINKTLSDWTAASQSLEATTGNVPTLWWKECYAQHFTKGHWDDWADAKRYRTEEYKNLKRQCYEIPRDSDSAVESETGIYNQAAEPVVKSFDIPIFRVYKASVPLHTQHYRDTDCTHYCMGDRGPMDHDHALMAKLVEEAIAGGNLPALPSQRSEKNQYDLQRRWDRLMEHPTDSLMSRMVCVNSKRSSKPTTWKADIDGMPPALRTCLNYSQMVYSGGRG